MVVLIYISLIGDTEQLLIYLLAKCPLWQNVPSGPLPIFQLTG